LFCHRRSRQDHPRVLDQGEIRGQKIREESPTLRLAAEDFQVQSDGDSEVERAQDQTETAQLRQLEEEVQICVQIERGCVEGPDLGNQREQRPVDGDQHPEQETLEHTPVRGSGQAAPGRTDRSEQRPRIDGGRRRGHCRGRRHRQAPPEPVAVQSRRGAQLACDVRSVGSGGRQAVDQFGGQRPQSHTPSHLERKSVAGC
jgi:hypothetical protein